jgi:hypothetical protein
MTTARSALRTAIRVIGFIADGLVSALVAVLWLIRAMHPTSAMVDHAVLQQRAEDYVTLREMEHERRRKERKRRRDPAP